MKWFIILILILLVVGCNQENVPPNNNSQATIDSLRTENTQLKLQYNNLIHKIDSILSLPPKIDSIPYPVLVHDTISVPSDSVNVRDSLVYTYVDSVNALDLNKLLFSKDSTYIDSMIHYQSIWYVRDSVKSITGDSDFNTDNSSYYFELKFYFDSSYSKDKEMPIKAMYYKVSGVASSQIVSLPYSYNQGYMKFDLGKVTHVDSIKLTTNQDGRNMDYWLSSDTTSVDKEKYFKDGTVTLGNTYIPNVKDIRWINISTSNGIEWTIKDIKVY